MTDYGEEEAWLLFVSATNTLTAVIRQDIHYTAQWSAPGSTSDAGGLCRLSGSKEDKLARDWFAEQVHSLKPKSYTVNGTGSQFVTFGGEDNSLPPIAMGSHLDSVATGGRFDGALGVIGALEVVRSLKEQDIRTRAPFTLINWTNEVSLKSFEPQHTSREIRLTAKCRKVLVSSHHWGHLACTPVRALLQRPTRAKRTTGAEKR